MPLTPVSSFDVDIFDLFMSASGRLEKSYLLSAVYRLSLLGFLSFP